MLVLDSTPVKDVAVAGTSLVSPLLNSRVPGLEGTLLKLELCQLTGSFKDRVMGVLVAQARAAGLQAAVVASSGNAAIAASAACARVGMPLLVLVPNTVSSSRVTPVRLRSATVLQVGDNPSEAHAQAAKLAELAPVANLSSTFAAPGCEWACRDIGREISMQVPEPEPVTHVVAPISVGPVLIGTATGLHTGALSGPALWAAQSSGCAPVARAFASGAAHVAAWTEAVHTKAHAIADRLDTYAHEADLTLERIRDSSGLAAMVSDAEMAQMRQDLARYDGLDVEFSACAAPALWRREGPPEGRAVCLLTGSGNKDTFSTPPGPTQLHNHQLEEFAEGAGLNSEAIKEVHSWTQQTAG